MKKSMLRFLNNGYNRVQFVIGELSELPCDEKILDAGAGDCQFQVYCNHLDYTSQDFVQNKNKTIDVVSDIVKMPFKNNSFDVVLCTEVMEHLFDPNAAMKELFRVLKKGGKIILTVPVCSLPHMQPHYYYNGFSEFWIKRIAKENNAKIICIEKNGCWNDWMNQEFWNKKLWFDALSNNFLYLKKKNDLCFGLHIVMEKK